MTELKESLEDPDKVKPIELKMEQLPRYEPVIPVNNKRYISHELRLFNLNSIVSFSTKLESTTQVFVYGHDLFLSRMVPDNSYDMLQENFSVTTLFLVIILILVGDVLMSRYIRRQNNKKLFLTR